jgi:bifunctional DNA-binding transcriptional regulator/antitoxin component of YhaV-PrlF toxin-antitoxin module
MPAGPKAEKQAKGSVGLPLSHLPQGMPMTAITLTANGQFTISEPLLEHLGIKAGQRVVVTKLPDHSLKLEAEKNKKDFFDLIGSLKTDIRLSDEQLEAAIGAGKSRARTG